MGAALLAGLGVGQLRNLDDCLGRINYPVEITPNVSNTKFYRDDFVNNWKTHVPRAKDGSSRP
jgi:glycerol kinase